MEPWQRGILLHHLGSFRALRLLHDPEYSGSLDAVGLYELVLEATGDEEMASHAAGERGMARLRAGKKV